MGYEGGLRSRPTASFRLCALALTSVGEWLLQRLESRSTREQTFSSPQRSLLRFVQDTATRFNQSQRADQHRIAHRVSTRVARSGGDLRKVRTLSRHSASFL